MKYFLKAKRYSLLDFLYNKKYGTAERVLFFDSEQDVISFFHLALEEDIVESSRNMDKSNGCWSEDGMATFETVMQFSSEKIGFRDQLRNNFEHFVKTYFSHEYQLKCNPRNYKLFSIQEKEVRGHKLNVVENLTWYKFYKKCLAAGMTQDEMILSKN